MESDIESFGIHLTTVFAFEEDWTTTITSEYVATDERLLIQWTNSRDKLATLWACHFDTKIHQVMDRIWETNSWLSNLCCAERRC